MNYDKTLTNIYKLLKNIFHMYFYRNNGFLITKLNICGSYYSFIYQINKFFV